MGIFFSVIFFLSAVCIILFLAISVYMFFFQKERYKVWLKRSGIAAAVLIVSVIGGVSTAPTREERAAMEQTRIAEQAQKEQEQTERKAKKEQEEAEKKQKEEQDAKAKEQAAADAAAQKVYDDQAEYEKWIRTSAIIGKVPGLGDRVDEFAKGHKISHDNGITKAYDDDHFNAVIVDGRIVNLTITAVNDHKMDAVIPSLMPTDGAEISSSIDNSDPLISKHNSLWHSNILDIAVPSSEGFYTRMDLYDTPSGNYLYTVLATGK